MNIESEILFHKLVEKLRLTESEQAILINEIEEWEKLTQYAIPLPGYAIAADFEEDLKYNFTILSYDNKLKTIKFFKEKLAIPFREALTIINNLSEKPYRYNKSYLKYAQRDSVDDMNKAFQDVGITVAWEIEKS